MKKLKKILLYFFIVVLVVIGGLAIFVMTSWDKTFDAPTPDISASTDSAMIARGKYLVFGPAHCATCHVPMDKIAEVESGKEIPLTGGWELSIPPGTFRAPNLTPDKETGIGNMTDGQIARGLRYSVKHDGSYLAPFMAFQNLSDEDIAAIISYLRSKPAVKNKVEPSEYTFLGKGLLAFGVLEPVGPTGTPAKSVKVDSTIEYGSYIASSVANCIGCHTETDMASGQKTGPDYAGGMFMPPDEMLKGHGFMTPNITPDPETGIMASWSEEDFLKRFQKGPEREISPMPWGSYSRMDDIELKALYRFLQSLKPVKNKIDKIVYKPGEEMPG